MGFGKGHNDWFGVQRLSRELWKEAFLSFQEQECDIKPSLDDLVLQRWRDVFLQHDFHRWKALAKSTHRFRQDRVENGTDIPDHHLPTLSPLSTLGLFDSTLKVPQCLVDFFQERASRFCQGDLARGAVKKKDT